jgi:hypothetical protein
LRTATTRSVATTFVPWSNEVSGPPLELELGYLTPLDQEVFPLIRELASECLKLVESADLPPDNPYSRWHGYQRQCRECDSHPKRVAGSPWIVTAVASSDPLPSCRLGQKLGRSANHGA